MSHSLETHDSSAMLTGMQISEGQVAITVRHDTSSPSSTAKQEFLPYFFFLYMMALPFMDLLIVLRVQIINQSRSPFEVNGVFMIIAIVALSVVTLTTVFMVSTSYYIQISSMRDTHYSILKAISCFFAILAPFSLGMVLYVPHSLNWIGYTLICVFLGIIAFYFTFGGVVSDVEAVLQENNDSNEFPKIYYNGLLVPISLVLVLFVPNNLNRVVITVIQLFFWIVIVYVILTCPCLHDFIKTTLKRRQVNPTIQEQQPSVHAVL